MDRKKINEAEDQAWEAYRTDIVRAWKFFEETLDRAWKSYKEALAKAREEEVRHEGSR